MHEIIQQRWEIIMTRAENKSSCDEIPATPLPKLISPEKGEMCFLKINEWKWLGKYTKKCHSVERKAIYVTWNAINI